MAAAASLAEVESIASASPLSPDRLRCLFGYGVLGSPQLGGHDGAVLFREARLLKRCDRICELEFYEAHSKHPQISAFLPAFYGCEVIDGTKYTVLENLLHGFTRPAMLDLKIGTRLYGDDASAEKKARNEQNPRRSTSGRLGVSVVGCQIPLGDDGFDMERMGHKYLRNVKTEEEVVDVLARFLRTEALRQEAQRFVGLLAAYFSTQTEFAIYGSSLFFAYDAALGANATLRLKMIDMAHVHPTPDGGLDLSYLTGIRWLQGALQALP